MSSSADTLLVLGAGNDQVFMIKTAHAMGLQTVAVDANPDAPGLQLANFAKAIDFSLVDEVIVYCEELMAQGVKLKGVSTMGSDIPHLVAAIAHHFGWSGPSLKTGEWASHKFKMKKRFNEMNIPVPRYAAVNDEQDILQTWQDWSCSRVVIKPTDRAGSRGVRIIKYSQEVSAALAYAQSYSLNGEILLEEFVEGVQISTESIIAGEQSLTPGFADRVYENMQCFWPNIMENGGWLPTSLNENQRQQISDLAENAARALGVEYGVAKGDVVICPQRGPMIIEMAARLSGGDFSESLVPLAEGINYVKTVIEIAVGQAPDLQVLTPKQYRAVANRYFFPPAGKLEDIRGLQWLKTLPQCYKLEVYSQVGDELPVIDSHAKRAGVFVLVDDSRNNLEQLIEQVYDKVRFKVDGQWCSAQPCEK